MNRRTGSILAALLCAGAFFADISLNGAEAPAEKENPAFVPCPAVVKGKAVAEIVIERRYASEPEQYAAEELQNWIGSITGAFVPVREYATENPALKMRFIIGTNLARKHFAADVAKLRQSDGFAVRSLTDEKGIRNVYLFGAIPRGTLHSIYAFLERNSDIIWARPNEQLGTIYSESEDFLVKDADFMEQPKTDYRGFQWIFHSPSHETAWQSRNRLNRMTGAHVKFASTYVRAGVGHGIQHYIPRAKYFESHPEYYPMQNGKRDPKSGQICLLAYEMIPEYVKNIRADLVRVFPASRNPDREKVDFLNLSIADNWHVCKCPKCVAPFVMEDGKTIQPDDPVFRSAQYYTFINKVARELRKTNPRVTIGVYAYIFTSEPPPFKLENNICIEYCPFVLNEKAPIYDEVTNGKWNQYLIRWGKAAGHTWLREYLGWANKFPRSQAYRIRDNGLYYIKHNIREFSAEHPTDGQSSVYPMAEPTWDVSAMDAWLIARMWWDPTQDLEALREQYITRVYREGAPHMKKYYDTLRDSFYSNKLPSIYSDDILPLISAYIVRPKLGKTLTEYLAAAQKAAQHPKSKELIRRHQQHLAKWLEMAANDNSVRASVPVVTGVKNMMQSFGGDIWKNAAAINDFVVADKGANYGKTPRFRSTARLLHDRENLYIYYQCYAPDMKELPVSSTEDPSIESIPRGDIMEFFLGHADTGVYYQFMFDAGNPDPRKDVLFEAKGQDMSWDCNWERTVKRYDDRWEAIVRVPLAEIGINVTQNNKMLFQPIRGKYYMTEQNGKQVRRREMASWNGGWVHQVPAFGELTLNQN